MASQSHTSEIAVRVAAAGFGAVVAGPLGGALGGLLAHVLTGPAANLVSEMAKKFGEKAAEKLMESGGDALADALRAPDADLEAVYRESLRRGLEMVHAHRVAEYDDWFANWSVCLKDDARLELPQLVASQLVAANLAVLLRVTLQRLDAQGAAMRDRRTTISLKERELPGELWNDLARALPGAVTENFRSLIVSEEYAVAWKRAQLSFQGFVADRLQSIDAGVTRNTEQLAQISSDGGQIRKELGELRELILQLAEQTKRIAPADGKALRAENQVEMWTTDYLEVMKQPALQASMAAGDLETAAATKQAEIGRQTVEQAKSYFELGKIHELRFDWASALEAYKKAWQMSFDPAYGYPYGLLAKKQRHFHEAEEIFERLAKDGSNGPARASALINLGEIYQGTQRLKEAEDKYFEAVEVYRNHPAKDAEEAKFREALIQTKLGNLYHMGFHRMGDAEKAFRLALDAFTELAVKDPARRLPDVAGMKQNLGNVLRYEGSLDEAETYYLEALTSFRRLERADPAQNSMHVATTLNNLAILYKMQGRMVDAENAQSESLEVYESLAERNHEAYDEDVATSLNNLAVLFSRSDREDKAVPAFERAIAIRTRLAEAYPAVYTPVLAMTYNDVAVHYQHYGMFEDGLEFCTAAENMLRPLRAANPEVHGDTIARVLGLKGDLWLNLGGATEEACGFYREALTTANEPALRKTIQAQIERFCGKPESTA